MPMMNDIEDTNIAVLHREPKHPTEVQGHDITPEKAKVRTAFRAARQALTPEARKKANKAILAKLHHCVAISNAKTILIYAATPNEVNLDDLIGSLSRAGKRVVVPRLTKTPGIMTLWAVRHVDALVLREGERLRAPDITMAVPVEPKDIDLALVPGVAFTATLGRLGQGGGYYDRVLSRIKPTAPCIGIAFEVQIATALPIEPHDVAMHAVVTESQVYGDAALLATVSVPASANPAQAAADAPPALVPAESTPPVN
jgi:5-formyltetrahydrofolate cyclo-ligase